MFKEEDYIKEPLEISRLIKKKTKENDIPLVVGYSKKEDVILPIQKDFKEKWSLSKTQTLFSIFITPLLIAMWNLLAKLRGYSSMIEFNNAIFRKDNEKMEIKIKELANNGKKRLFILGRELNTIGIEQGECYRQIKQAQGNALKCKKTFIQNPNLSTFMAFMDSMEDLYLARETLINVISRKLEKQREFVNCFNSLPNLDDRDIKDLKRALLADFAISFIGGRALFVATPIEMLIKSDKLVEKAGIDFLGWTGGFLYIGIVLTKNRQRDYSLWLNNLLRSIESRQNNH